MPEGNEGWGRRNEDEVLRKRKEIAGSEIGKVHGGSLVESARVLFDEARKFKEEIVKSHGEEVAFDNKEETLSYARSFEEVGRYLMAIYNSGENWPLTPGDPAPFKDPEGLDEAIKGK